MVNNISDISTLRNLKSLTGPGLVSFSNKISDISSLKDLKNLTYLVLQSNKISDISPLKDLKNLINIDLSFNNISDISFLKDLKKLISLDLSSNKISDFSFLKDLKKLTNIDLSHTQILDFSFLKDLKRLSVINLSFNNISDISFFKDLKNLTDINLSGNQIVDISIFKNNKNLQYLWMYDNKITNISEIANFNNLKELSFSKNNIDDFSAITKLKSLTKLSLLKNNISDISFLKDLKSLTTLDLSSNKISDISLLKDLKNLNRLHLQENPINELPKWITDFDVEIKWEKDRNYAEDFILFYNNPITNPPLEIVKQGKQAIKSYFEQIEKGEEYLFETKVLIIGEGGAGKTSFSVKMKDKNGELPKDKDTTLGIEVTQWDFETSHPKRDKQTMYANLWDFGGQKLYQGTHQIFFSQKSFYVLLDDTREEKTDFAYWLNTVEQLAGDDSKLLIVVNKKHEHVPQIDENGLKGRFGNLISDFITVDLKNDTEGIAVLQEDLKRMLLKLPGIGDALPTSWVNIRKELFEIKESFISQDRYIEICKKHKTDIIKLNFLSDYFNRIGVFTHYYDDKLLKNRIYLNSNWLVNTVYEVLNHKIVKDNKGRVSEAQIKEIWCSDTMFSEIDNLSQLMHRFGLMYEIDNTKSYVIPAHLPAEQPYTKWHHENGNEILQFAYEFDKYMPRGIMPRIIVALHRQIKNQQLVWNRGLNIELGNTFAEIKETYDKSNKFLIRIVGNQKKELLGVINNEFDKLLEPYKKLHYEKLVPCICGECKGNPKLHFFEHSDLIRRNKKQVLEIECKISYEKVNVVKLLDGVENVLEVIGRRVDMTSREIIERTREIEQAKNKLDKKKLKLALLSAYPNYDDLEMFMDEEFDIALNTFVSEKDNMKTVTYQLIKKMIAQGKIQELIEKAKADTDNNLIQKF